MKIRNGTLIRRFWLSGWMLVLSVLVLSAVAGILSSLLAIPFNPEAAIRAVMLAISLSLGLNFINHFSRKRLDEGQPPRIALATGIGALSGLLPGVIIRAYSLMGFYYISKGDFQFNLMQGWDVVFLCIGYGVALNLAYAQRWWFVRQKALSALFWIAVAGGLCGVLRAYLEHVFIGQSIGDLALIAAFTGLPFSLLWGVTVICLDPAWTFERWRKGG